jgi:hypothetical protein
VTTPKKNRNKSTSLFHKYAFNEKEKQILKEEISNPDSITANTLVFSNLLLNSPELRRVLFNPFRMLILIDSAQRDIMARESLRGTQASPDDFLQPILQELAHQIQPQALIGFLIPYMKQIKIKKDKRAILWAIGDLMRTSSENSNPKDSLSIRTLVLSSIQNAVKLSEFTDNLLNDKVPGHFDYSVYTGTESAEEDYIRILSLIHTNEPNLSMFVSVRATELFNQCERLFGTRFFHIMHYPSICRMIEKKSILMPGETQKEDEELSDDQIIALSESFLYDLGYWHCHLEYRRQLLRELVASVKSAAMSALEKPDFQTALQAMAFCVLFTRDWVPFFTRLYHISGEHISKFNPDDEIPMIIDLKSSPDNPRCYHRYAEFLASKKEYFGALNVYRRLSEILPEKDDTVEARIQELVQTLSLS